MNEIYKTRERIYLGSHPLPLSRQIRTLFISCFTYTEAFFQIVNILE